MGKSIDEQRKALREAISSMEYFRDAIASGKHDRSYPPGYKEVRLAEVNGYLETLREMRDAF